MDQNALAIRQAQWEQIVVQQYNPESGNDGGFIP